MFLNNLSNKAQISFLKIAKLFIEADKSLHFAEETMIEFMKKECGLEQMEIDSPKTVLEELSSFDSKKTKISVLLELIYLGYADHDYCFEERSFVSEIAKEFGVSIEIVIELENWIKNQLSIINKISEVLNTQFLSEQNRAELEQIGSQQKELNKLLEIFWN